MAILIVDDTPVNLMLLAEMLGREGYTDVRSAKAGQEALAMLMEAPEAFDLVLMDVMMPGMDGLEVCERIKADERIHDIPVILLTVRDDEEALSQAFAIGVADYIVKPVRETELLARVRAALTLKQEIDRRKEREQELLSLAHQLDFANRRLSRLAHTDSLTEVGNRRYFDAVFLQEWNRARREGVLLSLIMIDIDHFRVLNETWGRQQGDACLKELAVVLSGVLKRGGDKLFRYGSDEFLVILPNTPGEGAQVVAGDFLARLAERTAAKNGQLECPSFTVSLGVGCGAPARGSDRHGLVAAVESALAQAKLQGGGQIRSSMDCA